MNAHPALSCTAFIFFLTFFSFQVLIRSDGDLAANSRVVRSTVKQFAETARRDQCRFQRRLWSAYGGERRPNNQVNFGLSIRLSQQLKVAKMRTFCATGIEYIDWWNGRQQWKVLKA